MRRSLLLLLALLCTAALAQQKALPAPTAAAAAAAPVADSGPHPQSAALGEPHPLAHAVPAGPAIYDIELIIFRTTASLGAAEDWSLEASSAPAAPAATEEPGEAGEAAAPASAATTPDGHFVRTLAPADFQLDDIATRLRTSGIYVPLAHVAWAQSASRWGSHQSLSVQQLGIDVPGLSGTVTLERGQYLHLGLALQLQIANPPAGLKAAPQTVFTLNDARRVRFYERNYYDSPAFGVIALVTPAQGARRAGR